MTMNTNTLERTSNIGLDKKGMRTSSAYDLNELSDAELKGVSGGQDVFSIWASHHDAFSMVATNIHLHHPDWTWQQVNNVTRLRFLW
jgi:hypothetical protein